MVRQADYNHDDTWTLRKETNDPVWGRYSGILYRRIMSLIETHGNAAHSVLDIGCGAGKFGCDVLAANYHYTGVDESAVAIQLGKAHWPNRDLHHRDFAVGRADDGMAAAFGVVVSLNVLHCLSEPEHRHTLLANAKRCSVEGGLLVLTTMVGPLQRPHRAGRNPRVYFTPDFIIEELRQSGWNHILHYDLQEASDLNPVANLEVVCRNA